MMHTRPIEDGNVRKGTKRAKKYEKAETYLEVIILLGNVCAAAALPLIIILFTIHCRFYFVAHKVRNIEMLVTFIPPLPTSYSSYHRSPLSHPFTLTVYIHCHFLLFNKHIYTYTMRTHNSVVYLSIPLLCEFNAFFSVSALCFCYALLSLSVFHLFKRNTDTQTLKFPGNTTGIWIK